MTDKRIIRLAGCTFATDYPANLHRLNDLDGHAARGERLAVVLRRNPANPYDANAIEVHVPALGDIAMIGHLPAPLAAKLAPAIDAGQQVGAELHNVAIDPDHPDRPGCLISIWLVTS